MSLPIKKLSPAADAQARAAYQKLYETALPGQLLLEHGHADTIVLKKKAQIAPGVVPLNKRINGFTGCVYLEFSTPSMDEAGRFTDKRVIR